MLARPIFATPFLKRGGKRSDMRGELGEIDRIREFERSIVV